MKKKTSKMLYLHPCINTLDAQREKLHKYAEYQDMVIEGEYADEGFSGKNIQGRH